MVKSKWALALAGVLAVSVLSIGAARADETCKNHESRSADLEERVAEFEEIIRQTPTPPVPIKACSDGSVDLRSAAVGFKCRTSKDSIFERVSKNNFGEAWKGPDGLIWSDVVGKYSQYDALTACKNLGGALPSRADFERGEADGFREVLPNIDEWFWSSSFHPNYSYAAYGFSGYSGGFFNTYRSGNEVVRCVGQCACR